MEVHIEIIGIASEEDSYNLKYLINLIKEEIYSPLQLKKKGIKPGARDSGLTIGIAIASLSLVSIQTLILILQYWESKNPRYTLHCQSENGDILIKSITAKQIRGQVNELLKSSPNSIFISIRKE